MPTQDHSDQRVRGSRGQQAMRRSERMKSGYWAHWVWNTAAPWKRSRTGNGSKRRTKVTGADYVSTFCSCFVPNFGLRRKQLINGWNLSMLY